MHNRYAIKIANLFELLGFYTEKCSVKTKQDWCRLTINIDAGLATAAKAQARKRGQSFSAYACSLIEADLSSPSPISEGLIHAPRRFFTQRAERPPLLLTGGGSV